MVLFRCFLNFGPLFGPFLGTIVENTKHEKVVSGNYLNCQIKIKILASKFRSKNTMIIESNAIFY